MRSHQGSDPDLLRNKRLIWATSRSIAESRASTVSDAIRIPPTSMEPYHNFSGTTRRGASAEDP